MLNNIPKTDNKYIKREEEDNTCDHLKDEIQNTIQTLLNMAIYTKKIALAKTLILALRINSVS